MAKVKLDLNGYTVSDKIQFARQVITSLTGNPSFPNPEPPLADVADAASELETAFNTALIARQNATTQTSIQADKENALNVILSKLKNYVENTSNGDEAKILSSGMNVRAKATPIGDLPMPLGLAATESDKERSIDLSWDRVRGARSYIIEQSPDPVTTTSWKYAATSTKSTITVDSLVSGTKYWFRVAAVGAAGQGPWSDPATKYAP